jgi:DNA polymerase-1
VPVIADLERAGMPFDADAWSVLAEQATTLRNDAEADVLRLFAAASILPPASPTKPAPPPRLRTDGTPYKQRPRKPPPAPQWNLDALAQVRDGFARMGIDMPNMRKETLAAMAADHPVVAAFRDLRKAEKNATTYGLEFVAKHRHRKTGRIHSHYASLGADTGRLISSRPNLQNIPKVKPYRSCFAAGGDRVIIHADYGAQELRINAVYSLDVALCADLVAAGRDGDVYLAAGEALLGETPADPDLVAQRRALLKSLLLGSSYGMGAATFAAKVAALTGAPPDVEQARAYLDAFYSRYRGLAARREEAKRLFPYGQPELHQPVTAYTMIGRPRYAIDTFTKYLNSPIQGSASDLIKLATLRLYEHRGEFPEAHLINMVHDELVVEAPEAQGEEVAAWIVRHMEAAMEEMCADYVARAIAAGRADPTFVLPPMVAAASLGKDWWGAEEGGQK